MEKLKAFHNNPKIKAKYVARVKAHQKDDEIIQGKYWENGKGCAVGCTIHGSSHDDYPKELGISWRLALIEDSLFERLKNGEAKKFPLQFLQAVKVGSDTELVYKKFVIWVLGDKKTGLVNVLKDKEKVDLLKRILELYKKSLKTEITQSEWKKLADEAYPASASTYASAYAYASKEWQDIFDKRILQMRDKLLELLRKAK